MIKGLGGLGGLGDMGKMVKAAQEMQTRMAELQEQLAKTMVTGESGAGLVKATATAKGELVGLELAPSLFSEATKIEAEDLILAAIKDAQTRAAEKGQQEIRKLTESLGLPAGFNLPF